MTELGGLQQQRRRLLRRPDAAAEGPRSGRSSRTSKAWGNVLGFSGTNMRYMTITKSRWFNNGAGIVPNALDSEKLPADRAT